MIPTVIIYCPHLHRDIRPILAHVPSPWIYTGTQTKRGEDGCLRSHQDIVRQAVMNRAPAVFVIEDDCLFTEHFHYKEWCSLALGLEQYGIVVGGSVNAWGLTRLSPSLVQAERFCSAHCVVYHSNAYNRVLAATQPFDQTVGSAVLVHPFVATQAPCYSGILKREVDYGADYARFERTLALV